MRRLLMTSTMLAAMAVPPALAATITTGGTEPASTIASNIAPSDTHTVYSPKLPDPPVSEDAGPYELLSAASQAIQAKQTGEAQEALERAETRLLTRSVPADAAGIPDNGAAVQQITAARLALGDGDLAHADSAVQLAMQSLPALQSTVPTAIKEPIGESVANNRQP